MKGSVFVFNYVQLLYYKFHKINPYCGGSYIGSPDWTKSKKATINPINKKDNKCFQDSHQTIKKIKEHTERIAKIKPFIATYNWERMIYPLEKDS